MIVLISMILLSEDGLFAQDSTTIQVHFLYGSKPRSEYKKQERKWFGGTLGGHVGIEIDSALIVNFVPQGKYHVIGNGKNPHGKYMLHTPHMFWQILGNQEADVKKLSIEIPVSAAQRVILDSLSQAYLASTPYDYAFLGMRCGAATYDMLAQADILKEWSHGKTWRKIFYPRKLRKRLLELALENGWNTSREAGTERRKWEKDRGKKDNVAGEQ
jgi:hypothetical protein